MSRQRTYVGRSGQLAVLAELLFRQCNAATPEVDFGTDVFAFQDESEEVARLQVKTAQAERYKRGEGYSAQFSISSKQLERPDRPPLYYVLAARLEGHFADFLVISRVRLCAYRYGPVKFGTKDKEGNLVLTVQFRDRVICSDADLTQFRNAWTTLPPLRSSLVVQGSIQEEQRDFSEFAPPGPNTTTSEDSPPQT
jgi:hypothetical protein